MLDNDGVIHIEPDKPASLNGLPLTGTEEEACLPRCVISFAYINGAQTSTKVYGTQSEVLAAVEEALAYKRGGVTLIGQAGRPHMPPSAVHFVFAHAVRIEVNPDFDFEEGRRIARASQMPAKRDRH